MTLFNLAKKNILGNFKNYLIYFFSLVFSVVIYFTFVSLQYSSEIHTSSMPADIVSSIFLQASLLLILFVSLFVWYSNSFFTRNRKKEVGLYSLLGMRKRTIGAMLFYENIIMGAMAIVAGIVLGTLLSKLFAMILLRMLGTEVDVNFSVPLSAIINTILVFAVILLLTSINSYRLIYRFQLIQLFQAEKEGEQAPKAKLLSAGLAVLCIAFSYWISGRPIHSTTEFITNLGLLFGAIVIGTFLLFRSLTIYLLKLAQKNKSTYYKGMTIISISQLLYRMNANSRTLAMVTLLSTLTMLLSSVSSSTYYSNRITQERKAPFSFMHMSQGAAFDTRAEQIIKSDTEHPLTVQLDVPVVKTRGEFSDPSMLPERYYDADEKPLKFISASTFARLQQALGRSEGMPTLSGNQIMAIRPLYTKLSMDDFKDKTLKPELAQGNLTLTFASMTEERVMNWKFPDYYFVVSDALFADMAKQAPPVVFKVYEVKDEISSQATSDQLKKLEGAEKAQMSSFYEVYTAGFESAGLDMFIFAFLGLVFLAATGSVIYFKQLTDAHADKERYNILRKIGVSRADIHASIAKQTLFVFALPLVVGLTHSTVLITTLTTVFGGLIDVNLTVPIVTSMSLYVVIYASYYGLSVHSTNKIVNAKG